ncbi:sulfite oxidase heme-binding subunit YedZ [Undibacterium sp.]|uniref:sulfite oxidase heme-binding subunit YedZ n=1 Tax=Undibacterium sp. TaxID=1914977 RepID=UPI00374FF2B3
MKSLSSLQLLWVRIIVFMLAALPFMRLIYAVYADALGANPLEFITRNTGDWALYFLCISLSITPLRKLLEWYWLIRLRRMLGLYAFFYATLHFLTFLWFDHFFDLSDMWRDVIKRPFITVGFVAFVLLIPLAITSNKWMIRQLGGKQWQLLHRLVYLIAPLGVLHYFWMKAGKNLLVQPLVFAGLLALLLGLRLYWRLQSRIK